MPLGRRADKVQAQRRTVELRRLRHQYETTLHSLGMEVGAAVREVKANWVEFESRQLAPLATQPTNSGRIQLVEPPLHLHRYSTERIQSPLCIRPSGQLSSRGN